MITVGLNQPNFEYDIHSLIKAFYPQEEVLVRAGDEGGEAALFPEIAETAFHVAICYEPTAIAFAFCPKEGESPVLSRETPVDSADRKATKNRLKKTLYHMLEEFSGQTLPWGTLTGIRPTKIPLGLLEEGKSEAEIRSYMEETYLASDEKITLSLDVARRESELLSRIDYADGYSLYVGIPFCPSTCLYCSFTSYPISAWRKRVDEYLDALCKEIDYTARTFAGKFLNSVYIGGGTPTSLEPEQLERLITKIGDSFGLFDARGRVVYGEKTHLLEFTVEAGRPDSITEAKLAVLKRHNISRISINPQTMKEETLRLIGRHHTVEQVKESFALARAMGFDDINMDLIIGLPQESIEDVRRTMEELAVLNPDSVTVHSLAIKRAARLRTERESYSHLRLENTWETIGLTERACRRMGMEPYYLYRQKNMAGNFENVGYAKPGHDGVYNVLIMEEKQTIMALGAGATTKLVFDGGNRIERAANVKDITNYLARVDEMIARKQTLLEKYADFSLGGL